MENDERSIHFNKRTDKTYISRRLIDSITGKEIRIGSKVIDSNEGLMEVKVKDEVVVRATPKGRQEIIAKFFEDSRNIFTLTIQKFNSASGPSKDYYFSFVGEEINRLLQFILNIKRVHLKDENKINISDEALSTIILNQKQAKWLFSENEELFLSFAQSEVLKRDLVALGYRRSQLARFERLLSDAAFFQSEKHDNGGSSERVWQKFFEANKWIFGYGLSYISLASLDERKLEQITTGRDLSGAGKRTDALMKTQALISSLCFVEIKCHDTRLLGTSDYRPEVWAPSSELAGGVSQIQVTMQSMVERIGRKVFPTDQQGNPTGEMLFTIMPRSFLVIGSLAEFNTDKGLNEAKYRSFELFRRSLQQPEILTFDELLHRARYIVEHT